MNAFLVQFAQLLVLFFANAPVHAGNCHRSSDSVQENLPFIEEKSFVAENILSILANIENVNDEEIKQFVCDMKENEQIFGAIFTSKNSEQKVQKEKVSVLSKILNRNNKSSNQSEIEEKYCNLKNIKENDPAMSQVLQNLYALQQSKTSTQLKKAYLHFVIKFLAKRQHFEMSELLPLEGLNKQQILAELVKLWAKEKHEKSRRRGQNQKKSQKHNSDNKEGSSGNSRQKRLLRLLLTATNNDGNGTSNLSMEFGNGNRKRRKKRDLLMSILIIYLIVLAAIIEFRHNIRDCGVDAYRRCHGCCFPLRSRGQSSENWQQHEDTIPTAFIVLNLTPATQSNNISVAFRALPEQQMHEAEGEQKLECAVCLGHIEPGTMVRSLPSCKHLFHSECIEHWIKTHNKCPLCRAEPFKINNKGEVTPNYAHCPPTVQEKPAQEHAVQQHPVQGRPEVHEHAVDQCLVHGNSVQQHAVQGHSLLESVHEHTMNVGLSETGNAVENV